MKKEGEEEGRGREEEDIYLVVSCTVSKDVVHSLTRNRRDDGEGKRSP